MKKLYCCATLILLLSFISSVIQAQFPYFESWKNNSSANSVFGGGPTSSFLTSGKTVTIHGGTGFIADAPGEGFLRLTGADTYQTGYVYNNTAFPADKGFKISFEYFTHGGNGGEGTCFFLFDAATPSFNIGASAGSLGYAQNTVNGTTSPGVSNGFLGIGLDEGGCFSKSTEGRQGGYSYPQSQSVVLRGAGNGAALTASNYPYLTMTRTTFWNSATNPNPNFGIAGGAKREPDCSNANYRKVFIELKPKAISGGTTSYDITVKIMVGGSTTALYTVINNYTGFSTAIPTALKYGISAASSDKTDFHEIRNLSIIPYYSSDGSVNTEDYSITACFNYSGATGTSVAATAPVDSNFAKIPIDPNRWFQLTNNTSGLDGLFDSITNVQVITGYGKVLPIYDAYYPVKPGEEINISGVRFYDGEGIPSDSTTLSVITNQGQKIPVAIFKGTQYNSWVGPNPTSTLTDNNKFKLDSTFRNIKYLVLNIRAGLPTEMQILGTYKAPPAETPAVKKSVKIKEMLGINAFEWDFLGSQTMSAMLINPAKIKAMKSFAGIRHYMDWEKLESIEGKYTFNPCHSGGWAYDVMYQRCKEEGIEVLACMKTIPIWMQNTYPSDQRDNENTPLRYGKDFADPASYIEQAKLAFQYTARYGRNQNFDSGMVTVQPMARWTNDPPNVVKKGLNLIKYLECDNERNKWWKGRKAYQTAYEYAANLSAFYDGHKNTMGPGVGVKNADSTMVVVMGGLAASTTEYVRGMIDWCKKNRGYKADGSVNLCWDVINYHAYPNNSESFQGQTATRGAAPEKSGIARFANDFIQMAHEYAKDMEVWVSETGYDTNQLSVLRAIPVGNRSILETQADWILRTALLYARTGIKRTYFYQTQDLAPQSGTSFASMGLLSKDLTRRPATDFIYQTKQLFGEYSFKETINADPIADRYELNGKSMYALVVPDETGRTAGYTLDLGTADSANIYSPVVGSDSMKVQKVATVAGKLQMTVTETPVFVMAAASGPDSTVISGNRSSAGAREEKEADDENKTVNDSSITLPTNSVALHTNDKNAVVKSSGVTDSLKVTLTTDTRGLDMLINNMQPVSFRPLPGIITGKDKPGFNNFKIYPNPTSGTIRVVFSNDNSKKVEMTLLEPGSGKTKKRVTVNKDTNDFSQNMNLGELPNGIYILEIRQGNERVVEKIIKIEGIKQ